MLFGDGAMNGELGLVAAAVAAVSFAFLPFNAAAGEAAFEVFAFALAGEAALAFAAEADGTTGEGGENSGRWELEAEAEATGDTTDRGGNDARLRWAGRKGSVICWPLSLACIC